MPWYLVTATVQLVLERKDASDAGMCMDYGLKGWMTDRECQAHELDSVFIEAIEPLDDDRA